MPLPARPAPTNTSLLDRNVLVLREFCCVGLPAVSRGLRAQQPAASKRRRIAPTVIRWGQALLA
jgi:hypothetical protein